MNRLLILCGMIAVAGCTKEPESKTPAGKDFVVDQLFTHEGCTVYRFHDAGSPRYYTNCHGSTTWTSTNNKVTNHHQIETRAKP